MSNPKSAARPASGTPGVKLLITAASLVSTIGGWALISNSNATASSSTTAPIQPATMSSINFGPLPTLVPTPDPKTLALNAQPVIARANPIQSVAAPPPAPPPLSGLRIVNGPGPNTNGAPPPAAKTRSSKP